MNCIDDLIMFRKSNSFRNFLLTILLVFGVVLFGHPQTGFADSVWTWGYNDYGQLGDGTRTSKSTPIRVSGLTDVVAFAGGGA